MGEWSNLTQREKSNIIRFAIKNGVSDINTIRDTFNVYAKDSLANVDYNMAAAKASGFGSNGNGHYPDTFKKPNHPTFSDESIYHSEATPGGRWRGNTYEPSDFVLNQQGGWNNFLKGFYNQEQGTGAVPVFNGGVMLPEITVTSQYKEGGGIHIKHPGRLTALKERTGKTEAELWATGNAHTRKMITFARNARKWHKHEDGGSNWMPDFAKFPVNKAAQYDIGNQLVQSILQDENIQRAIQQKSLQRQAEIEAKRRATHEIYNGLPNPGAGYVSGTDPLLQAIVDMTPAGDAEMATEAASELKNGNIKEAGLLGAALLLPNIFNKGLRRASKNYSKKAIDFSDPAFDKDILNDMRKRQYQDYLATGNLWDESLVPIPQEHLGYTVKSLPEDVVSEFEHSVYPRMATNRPWINSDDLVRNARTRIGNEYSVAPEVTFNNAGLETTAGAYYPETDRIVIRNGYVDYALPHEVRHKLDNGIELTEEENNILERAFGREFIEMPNQTTRDMADEMVTTNLDARRKLLGNAHGKDPINLQNKLIDRMSDDRVIEAIRKSNGYGRKLISILEEQGKLTPERISAFREAMKKVGIVAVPIAGVSTAAANNQKSTGGPLYPFSFQKNPYWKTPVVRY